MSSTNLDSLLSPTKIGSLSLKNRVVMAPLTRSRAIGNVPNDLMEKYYKLRADAGLIITEGTSPSANGLGYARMPGVFSDEQVKGCGTAPRIPGHSHPLKLRVGIRLCL